MTPPFPDPDDLAGLSLSRLGPLLRDKEISPVDLMDAVFRRIESLQPELNAFITLCPDAALEGARQAETEILAGRYQGPLHGIPFSVKDLTLTAGVRTTMGSKLFETLVPDSDAVAVERLKAAGALLIGKTTTPAFGHKPLTEGLLFGRTLSPFDPGRTCGGSSGGAAVALASGQGPLALGSDGGGSIRIPAACCGVVGLKATLGVIPNLQPPDLFGANSYVGPMARSVTDTALAFEVLAGFDARDPFGLGRAPEAQNGARDALKIGWLPRVGNRLVDGECLAAAEAALHHLEDRGAVIEEAQIDFVALEKAFLIILQSLLCARLDGDLRERPECFEESLAKTVEAGRRWTAADLQRANAERSRTFSAVQALFQRFDVLVSPTLAAPPLPAAQDPHAHIFINGQDAGRIRAGWYPYTYAFNLTGHPALAVPFGKTATSGLPLSVQLVGPWHSESRLLRLGQVLEEAAASRADQISGRPGCR